MKLRFLLLIIFILSGVLIFILLKKKMSISPSSFAVHSLNTKNLKSPFSLGASSSAPQNSSRPKTSQKTLIPEAPIPQRPKIAIIRMTSLLKKYSSTTWSLDHVIRDLDDNSFRPHLLTDSNPYTGHLMVLRTESPLPGTRYFHGQYFLDKNNRPFLQHMSFDIQASPAGFEDAIGIVKNIFGKLPKPSLHKKDFIMWPWKNGYNIWVQKLSFDQLKGDPYNAYESADAGTIKIALELDTPHADTHSH